MFEHAIPPSLEGLVDPLDYLSSPCGASTTAIMEGKLDITTLVLLAVAGTLYLALNHFLGVRLDEKEPPLVPSTIPFIGHILGLVRSGTKYYAQLR